MNRHVFILRHMASTNTLYFSSRHVTSALEPLREKMFILTSAPSEDIDQPEHPCSLIRFSTRNALASHDPQEFFRQEVRTLIRLSECAYVAFYVLTNKTLRKHIYSNILKILPPKNEKKNQIKKSDIFNISAQNIDCGRWLEPPRRGGSNEYPQSIFLSRNKRNNVHP